MAATSSDDVVVNIFDDNAQLARQVAREAITPELGQVPLINQWREVAKPRKRGSVGPDPSYNMDNVPWLFMTWAMKRQLVSKLVYTGKVDMPALTTIGPSWHHYNYNNVTVPPQPNWERRFHGTWWYSAWSTIHTGSRHHLKSIFAHFFQSKRCVN